MSSKHPNPLIPCRCGAKLSGTNRVRVQFREGCDSGERWKILERYYSCPRCYQTFWHEVAAKADEGGL